MNSWVYGLFILLWILTFLPAWRALLKLLAFSVSDKPVDAEFILIFIYYRLIIVLPYLALLIFGQNVPGLLKNIVVGIIILGFVLSAVRFFLRDKSIILLWNVYSIVYDGLLKFYPYTHLLDLVAKRIDSKRDRSVLDAGCGTGNLSRQLASANPNMRIVAIDESSQMIRIARKKLRGYDNVEVCQASVKDYLAQNQTAKFDDIVLINVLYALEDHKSFWAESRRHLKGNGRLIISNSDRGGSWSIIKEHLQNDSFIKLLYPKLLGVYFIDHFISQLAAVGKFNFLSQETLQKEIHQAGGMISNIERCYGGRKGGVNLLFTVSFRQ